GGRRWSIRAGAVAPVLSVAGAVAVTVGAAIGLWLASGVGGRDILLFGAYQAGYVAVPGCLLYRVLAPRDSLARTLVWGWVLGYAVEVLAYLVASVLGVRGLYAFYPLLAVPLVVPFVRSARVPSVA